jgi:uncharacterized protein (TIGR00661 family)
MRILYGVVGEGMGHAMRSRVVLDHLLEQGHEVEVMTSGRAVDYLRQRFAGVNRIHGFHIVTEENRMRRGKTLWSNALKGAAGIPRNIAAYFRLIDDFQPNVVISDFESWTYYYAKSHRLPVLSVDNMQIINRGTHPPELIEGERMPFELARALVKAKLPFCDHYLVTTFFQPLALKPRTSLYPPILRPEILAAERRRGEHLLVYQNITGFEQLAEVLRESGVECRIYGLRKVEREQIDRNLRFRPFDEAQFIEDLATCRGVVGQGGFTLMSEAVYLRKPMLSVPIGGQFEQILNARYLEREGFGRTGSTIDAAALSAFLDAIPACERALEGYSQDGNREILAALDDHLARLAA